MEKKLVLAAVLTAALCIIPLSGRAEEELFDTKAAAKHTEQGIVYLKAKNLNAAIKEFEESAAMNPEAEAFYYLGYAYYLKGRGGDANSRVQARENFDKAYELEPNFSPTRFKPAGPPPVALEKKQEQAESPTSAATPSAPTTEPAAPQQQPKP
jgi:tetratricopeptide (TPR) repeat protein